jgi:hypothetical protein
MVAASFDAIATASVLFEQRVELGYQWQNFQRLFGGHSFAPPSPDISHSLAMLPKGA